MDAAPRSTSTRSVLKVVAVVLRDVAHAVGVHVAGRAEAAQADVVADPAAFAGFKGDADDVLERALEAVLALVVH
jgi:hypothetical protein